MQKTFSPFGVIQDIRVFKDKGYAFIRFATKESATHAIENIHNTEINGQVSNLIKPNLVFIKFFYTLYLYLCFCKKMHRLPLKPLLYGIF